jgi:hypothetical protein
MTEEAYEVALLDPSGAELLGTSTTAKLEDQIVVLRADVDLAASLRVRISSAAAATIGMGAISYSRCSEGTTPRRLGISGGEYVHGHNDDDVLRTGVLGVSRYNCGQS